MNWYIKVWKNAVNFNGRARRSEYWYFVLFNMIISFVIGFVEGIAGLQTASGLGMISTLYSLAVILPSLSVGVRRLHDIGKSGWMILISLLPCIGALILLFWYTQDSQPGSNQYGENPKGA